MQLKRAIMAATTAGERPKYSDSVESLVGLALHRGPGLCRVVRCDAQLGSSLCAPAVWSPWWAAFQGNFGCVVSHRACTLM